MKKLFLGLMIGLGLMGCGYNPMGVYAATGQHIVAPTVEIVKTFDELVVSLDTPTKIIKWMNDNRPYDATVRAGWEDDPIDVALGLARALYYETGLVCHNYAGFMVYCLRLHGYTTGAVVYLQKNGTVAHVGAYWLEGEKIRGYSLPRLHFENMDKFKQFWVDEFDNYFERDVHNFYDEFMKIVE